LALTRQQLADLIGGAYRQAHQYEKGIGRVAIGPLCKIGRALDVEVSYFFEDCRPKAGSHHRLSIGYSWNLP
jgi:transcriptional regulator with XRE-family HTH domain